MVRKISSRSLAAAVTVMVPNSLGPGELLMRFGTKEQQDRWLPRLADGRDIPCFGLTSPEAGPARSTLVFIEPRDRERAGAMQQALARQGIHVAYRAGALRLAPHLYNTGSDIDRALSALDAVA